MTDQTTTTKELFFLSYYVYLGGLIFSYVYNFLSPESNWFDNKLIQFFYETDSIIFFVMLYSIIYVYFTLSKPKPTFVVDDDDLDNPFGVKDVSFDD